MGASRIKVLLIGKGGREHSLAWNMAQSPSVEHIYVVPGNGGTDSLAKVSNIRRVRANDYPGLVALAQELGVGLVVAGPDDVVVDGIEGYFQDIESHSNILSPKLAMSARNDEELFLYIGGIPCFAPTKAAAEIEGSKTFAKGFMKMHRIPTADYQAFSNYDEARRYLDTVDGSRVVIRVDGLAAGKGVILGE